jgi:nuclear transport factor 2 (NTF2) superfamily protein
MLNDQQFTGDDFFADKDVCGIVLEVPNSALPRKRVGLWARTLIGARGGWVQVDRGALPAQAVFLVGEERGAYLAGEPVDDARFGSVFAHSLEHLGGYTPEQARRVAGTLLPEILPYDPTRNLSRVERKSKHLTRKWNRELDYRLIREVWAFRENRIAVRFAYEWHDDSGNWFRSYGNENWEFDADRLMRRRIASINDLPSSESERKYHWPLGRRPDDHPSLSDLGL